MCSTNTAFLFPRSCVIYFAFASGVAGSTYGGTVNHPSLGSGATLEIRRVLTEFPMTKIRLLKFLRSKTGKASTERTGHLGIVDLVMTTRVSEYIRE